MKLMGLRTESCHGESEKEEEEKKVLVKVKNEDVGSIPKVTERF